MSIKAHSALALVARAFLALALVGCGGKKGPVDPPVDNQYKIEIRFYGPEPSAAVRAAFDAAQGRIQAMITADLIDTRINNVNLTDPNTCGVPATVNETVDDLVIYATIKTIDGVGKVQASSGPCLVRSTTKLPVLGRMEMDLDDLNQLASTGRLNAVVLHEMLHVVGFGTIWEDVVPVRITGAGTGDPRFTGPLATQACNNAGGSGVCGTGVPLENCVGISGCGEGTRDSHWREPVFRTELMTGYVEATNVPMPLSAMTLQSLADLGYSVTLAGADTYSIPGTAIMVPEEGVARPVWEITRRPSLEVSPDGTLAAARKR